ncbi:MAG TPA: ABC transporter ATP-binding protein [Actinobacteria bacterium]|nr:oligopeptide transport ATP-binding protein OppD [bacterium BMS3Bbin02]HDL42285.1 ABC transporter ATP-binding protein [Actinomycetota bacterium]
MSDVLLAVDDLRTYFATEEGVVRAVDGVSFTINRGERRGVVGESGSGKSVTAMSIMGLIEPPAGQIVTGAIDFDGLNLLELPEDEMRKVRGGRIAMIFQDPMTSLNPVYTIGQQLIETIVLHQNVSKSAAREIAAQSLADVQIPYPASRLDDFPHQFSGGMRQRVMIAMGLSCNPELLIADEPTTALDVTTQAQILDLMLALADDRGTSVLLITHDLGVVAGFCDTVQVMYAGGIVESGSASDIFYDPKHPYSWGLLGSMTRLDAAQMHRLNSVRGAPPSVINLPEGCRFRPRCDFALDVCRERLPLLGPSDVEGHTVACHRAAELDLKLVTSEGAPR